MGSLSRAERNIAWVEKYCKIPDGAKVGEPYILPEYMKADFYAIYDNVIETRTAIISRGRKNFKTTEAAVIVLLHLVGPEAQVNSELYSAAQDKEQAAILYGKARKIIEMSPDLASNVITRDTKKELECRELGTVYKALSSESKTKVGLNPALIVHDELGQVRGPTFDLYDILENATGAQERPLSIIISTQAPNDGDLLSILIDDAQTGRDKSIVLRFDYAPDEVSTWSIEALKAANPAFNLGMNQKEVLKMQADAKAMPSKRPSFENYVLNRRVDASEAFITKELWKSCGGINSIPKDAGVYIALDLSQVRDLTAKTTIAEISGIWHVKSDFWLPKVGIKDKSESDHVPYNIWAEQGFLHLTNGKTIDFDTVAEALFDDFQTYNVLGVAFDRWNWDAFRKSLLRVGFSEEQLETFIPFGQGYKSMSPALRQLEADIIEGKIAHGNHPVMAMCANNARVDEDHVGNRRLVKPKDRKRRIDGMITLTMARGIAVSTNNTETESIYETQGLLIL